MGHLPKLESPLGGIVANTEFFAVEAGGPVAKHPGYRGLYGHALHPAAEDVQPVAILHATSGHDEFVTHEDPGQLVSHRQDAAQSTPLLQAPLSQVTEHAPGTQTTPAGQPFAPQ